MLTVYTWKRHRCGVNSLRPRPLALIILDGWGLRDATEGNAVRQARTPNMDLITAEYPYTALTAHGEAVGLLEGQMGNSNVGHLNLGAGRIVYQDIARIYRSIRDGSFFRSPVLAEAVHRAKRDGGALHLMGLVSDGGVHSHIDHLIALLELAEVNGLDRVYIHSFLDGRDVPPACAERYLRVLEERYQSRGLGRVATVMGRYYSMDRDNRWDRTKKAYLAMVRGDGPKAGSALEALSKAYERGETDEFVLPTVVTGGNGLPIATIRDRDSVIFFNFRADRARQITRAFTEPGFDRFEIDGTRPNVYFASMTQYDEDFQVPYVFGREILENTFGEVISRLGLRQLRIAETEKYAHVTYFFSGGREEPFDGEDRKLIPSPRVPTYDMKPEMSAYEVAREAVSLIRSDLYDVVILNFANPDMVGHTGIMGAAVKAIEAVDACMGQVVACVRERGGVAVVLADHGNAEEMVDPETGEPHTAHTCNRVPCVLVDDWRKNVRLREGILADVAPTLIELLGVEKPPEMTHDSLILKE